MSQLKEGGELPKSMRHKQVLDVAEEHPDASLSKLASMVPSATTDLVEHVLDEYGDPAADEPEPPETAAAGVDTDETSARDETEETDGSSQTAGRDSDQRGEPETEPPEEANAETEPDTETETSAEQETESETGSEAERDAATTNADTSDETEDETETDAEEHSDGDEPYPSLSELTEKQRETLRTIAENPEATQTELATRLDVSAPTICNRVNSIEGFDWSDRQAFVDAVFETDSHDSPEPASTQAQSATQTPRVSDLEERLNNIERQLDALVADTPSKQAITDGSGSNEGPSGAAFEDPELVSKVVHACMDAETISEEEELRIVRALIQ